MAYIDFKKLKARVSLADVLDHYGLLAGLQETAHGYQGACPFCGSNAFKVTTGKNAWFCFGGCQEDAADDTTNGGNMLDFVVRKEGVSVKEAAARVVAWFPIAGKQAPNKNALRPVAPPPADAGQGTTPAVAPSPPAATSKPKSVPTAAGEGAAPTHASSTQPPPSPAPVRNEPLAFTLKTVTFEHAVLNALGFERTTLERFGVGYFTGKGIMHNRIVIPFHNADGLLVAYAGYDPEDRSYRYPDTFVSSLELFNVLAAESAEIAEDSLVVVTDLLNVLRLYELDVRRVVAVPTEALHAPQLARIRQLVGDGGQIDLVPWTKTYVDILAPLVPHFHVRLHRYHEGSEDEFIAQVASSLGR